MGDERKGFSFLRSYYEAAKELETAEERSDFLMAICSYVFDGKDPEIHGVAAAMFRLAKPNIETSLKRSIAGAIGGSKSKSNNKQIESGDKSNANQNVSKTEANVNDSVSDIGDRIKDIGDRSKEKGERIKEIRHKYGQYNNVLLSDTDVQKLKSEFPTDWEERVEKVSTYCASHGKTYKDYLATIRSWARNEKPKQIAKNDPKTGYQRALQLQGITET